jgi:hypothetical protein
MSAAMPVWLILAAAASIAATAILTFLLYRINAPMMAEAKRDQTAGDGGPGLAENGGSDGGGGE